MKGKVIGSVIVLSLLLAACAPSSTTTAPLPATTGPTAASPTAPPVTTKPVEKPQYGGTLNLVMLLDISSWDQGLTGC